MKRKNQLLYSVISLVLCVSMLVGATFAWFTDAVQSGMNTINAGNLDVELLADGKQVTATTKLFDDVELWEPGVVVYENLQVVNKGSLALKYQMMLNFGNENDLNGHKLSEVLKVAVVDKIAAGTDRQSVLAAAKASAKIGTLADFYVSGQLEAGQTATEQAVVIFWDPNSAEIDNLYNANNGQTTSDGLPLHIDFGVKLEATQAMSDSELDSFGKDYDANALFPSFKGGSVTGKVPVENGYVTADTQLTGNGFTVLIPAGVRVADGVDELTASVVKKDASDANVKPAEGEELRPLDVHVEGVHPDNRKAMPIKLEKAMMPGLNLGNYTLYHVENGQDVAMTLTADPTEHNQFSYDPVTGDVTVALASFSEVAMVAEQPKWKGEFDYSWYTNAVAPVDSETAQEYVIANADQLAAFGAIVGGMNGQTQDSFKDKTVKLISDINLGDSEEKNNPDIIFYPIGYYNSEGTYERTNTAITSGLRNFEGTFDGNGHTVSNFYQNTWEMKGDHNWYTPEEQYYRDGMGLFGRVYGGTVKNLTVRDFSSDGEIATTGVIAAYADGATFENIAIFDCNPRVYNIGNGGIVGCVGWYAKEAGLKTTFKNITVDNSNKISALWGSYDVACGGIVGQYYPTSGQTSVGTPSNGGIEFVNCHISAQMDVYNDVCGNYQYYAYRYAGMLIGSVRENETIDGHVYPKMAGITAEDCTVHFGTWNDYYYCEIIDNTTASYTHDYQMSRLVEIKAINGTTITYLDGTTGTVPASGRANYVIVDYTKGHGTENATCYHFKDGAVWTHDMGGIQTGVDENKDGQDDLKEDKQHIYLEFNNLVTGYGWGVTSKGVDDLDGVTILDREVGNSVEKFEGKVTELANNKEYKLGDIFNFVDKGVELIPGALAVSVNNLDEKNPVSAEFNRNAEHWENGTIKFTGTGKVQLTIQDYYFCTPTTITVNITERVKTEKFDIVMNNGDFLHRVGNQGTVALDKLFKAKAGVSVGTVSVTVEAVNGTAASGTYSNNAIQFSGTGVVKVTITDNDYCTPTVLTLEVVDAVNATTATSATDNNVVLLNDCGLSSLTVSGRYAFYGNGFTATYTGNGQYLNNGLKQGVITVKDDGTLDNLRIVASVYPAAYLYFSEAQQGPADAEGKRFSYQLSAVSASGNATIQNCYIYGGRTNIYIGDGNVTVKDSVLECGTFANVQIISSSDYSVTFDDVTTIQHQMNATVGDTSKIMYGAGILVGDGDKDNTTATAPTILLNGAFKQYNWVTEADKNAISDSNARMIINGALNATGYNHTVNGVKASNLGIIFLNGFDETTVTNKTGLPYAMGSVSLSLSGVSVTRTVCSLKNASADQIYSDYVNADKDTGNGYYAPQFKYPADLGGQYIEKTEEGDEFCYREGDTIKVMFPSGDTKELDLGGLVSIVKYGGQNLNLQISCKDSSGNDVTVKDGKVSLSTAGEYTVTYRVTDTWFYDAAGNKLENSLDYSWDIIVDVALKDTAVPNAEFEFDSSVQKIYRSGNSNIVQFIPFLSGLKIYDYDANGIRYLRFDGGNTGTTTDYNKIAKASVENINTTGEGQGYHIVTIELVDGGKLVIDMDVRANSGSSTHSGSIKVRNNVIYVVNGGTTSGKGQTWKIYSYKFIGNNGTEINSGLVTFGTAGTDCDTASKPSSSFGTTVKYTVTYDANGGNCGQSLGYATSTAAAVTLPTPSKSGYVFAGWYTAASGGTKVGGAGESYTPSADITLYAQWGKPCTVTYNANGGSCGVVSEKYTGTALTLPTPTRDGYWFVGWYDAAEGGKMIGEAGTTYNPSGETTLYAHWQQAIAYTVTYNANGGSCGTASATYQGTALTLPTPTRTGYTFKGWYTAASGGTKIGAAGASYIPSANITLHAQWQINSYTITVTTNNATVKVNGTQVSNNGTVSVQYGAQVTVDVTYSKDSEQSTSIKGADGTGYTSPFTMPAQNVTINATSSDGCVTGDTLVTLADGTQKRIDQLTYQDELLVWDFYNGCYTTTKPSVLFNHGDGIHKVTKLQFSDGTVVSMIDEHEFFDMDANSFVNITEANVAEYVGHRFAKTTKDGFAIVTLESYVYTEEETGKWTILTAKYNNAIVEGMLSLTPDPTNKCEDFFRLYEVGENMKYDEAKMQADIEKYGLFTYEDLADYVTYEEFVAFNGEFYKILVGKGLITVEDIVMALATYAPNH